MLSSIFSTLGIMSKLGLLLVFFLSSCVFPQDPENSYSRAQDDYLLVGVVENPPYTGVNNKEFSGTEVDMLRKFAEVEGLSIRFEKGSESAQVKDLEAYKKHVVIGGFEKKTIWKKKAGLTVPYDKQHVFLIPKGENRLLEHLESFIFQEKKQKK